MARGLLGHRQPPGLVWRLLLVLAPFTSPCLASGSGAAPSLDRAAVAPAPSIPRGVGAGSRRVSMESLIHDYGSDSSGGEHDAPAAKRQRLSPKGDATSGGALRQGEAAQVSADGRVRSFPHVEGNYAGFVYVPMRCVPGLEQAALQATKIAAAAIQRDWKHGQADCERRVIHRIAAQDLHLSVSKTFALRRGQIAAAVARLRQRLRVLPCFEAAVSGIQLYSNEDRTRSFIGLSLDQGAARMQVQQQRCL